MTPEEIIDKNRTSAAPYHPNMGEGEWISKEDAIKSMKEYAEQEKQKEAVGFNDWMRENVETANGGMYYYKHGGVYTSSELYALYQKENEGKG